MRISEAATASGLSIHTIRYYEKLDLLPSVGRVSGKVRHFSRVDIEWLILLSSLRETGMPLKKMKQFASLYRRGDRTVAERKAVLLDHLRHLDAKRKSLDRCAELLAFKLKRYEEIARQDS